MQRKVLFLLALVFVCAFSANSQTNITVDESRMSAFFADEMFFVNIPLKNDGVAKNAKIKLQILDENDKILAKSLNVQTLQKGSKIAKVPVRFSVEKNEAESILGNRLKYEISAENQATTVSGIVSFSEIIRDVFSLQIVAAEDTFTGMNYKIHVIAVNPITSQPVKDVKISGELRLDTDVDELKILTKGKTNSDGFVTLGFQIPLGAKLDDDGDIKISGEKNGIRRDANDDLDIAIKSLVYLNTDKPIYQPNQKLFVRGLYLNPLKKPLADRELQITISGKEADETVFTQTVKTSLFGIGNFEWQIPENIKLGKYKIEVENENGQTVGSAEFKITRYDLPNFSVSAKPEKSFYLPNDGAAKITVSAEYLFGKPVAGGKVRIVELDNDEEIVGTIGESATDKDGKFTAAFDLSEAHKKLKSEKEKQFEDLKFKAYFTDATTNKTEEKRFDLRVSKEAIHVYFARYAVDANPKLPYQFYVSTFYADGSAAVCDFVVKGNYENAVASNAKLAEAKTNSYGVSKFTFTIPPPFSEDNDEFYLEISARDKQGRTGNFYGEIEVDEDEKQVYVTTGKIIYRQTEDIRGEVFSTDDEDTLIINLVKNSGVIFSKRIKVSGNKGAFQIPFQPDFKGELSIFVYSLKDSGYDAPVFSKSLIFPSPEKLDFNIKSLKSVYRPNENAKISFDVRNGEGKATETAFGILILDKAIEEQAATENLPDNFAGIRKLLGTDERFGNLTRRDLKNLDLRKPISDDLQLAAEFLIVRQNFEVKRFETDSYKANFPKIYEEYFRRELEPVEEVLKKYSDETGEIPVDENSLREILKQNNIELEPLRDAWGTNYDFEFNINNNRIDMRIVTAGADKQIKTGDDFTAAKIEFQRYRKLQYDLYLILDKYKQKTGKFPATKEELIKVWKDAGFDFESLRDDWNHPFYIESYKSEQNAVKPVFEKFGELDGKTQAIERVRIVSQETVIFKIRSSGADGVRGNYDDFDAVIFAGVLEESVLDGKSPAAVISKSPAKNGKGTIRGTLVDPNGAVIPGFVVEAVSQNDGAKFSVTSNDVGEFIFSNLPSGTYDISTGGFGFQTTTIKNIVVSPLTVVNLRFPLEIGAVSSVVEVTSDAVMIDTTDSRIATTTKTESKSIANFLGNKFDGATSTPRVREYFPKTLVWQPEIITDKKGRAEIDFKLADSLTTWKFYAVGSTKTGEIEMVEREFQTFQTFFAELEPPKILTEGDEISLPVPVRNYTAKRQNVSVEMAKNSWSNLLNTATQKIEVPANSTANAIFNFRADAPIENGKQKVTALAAKESDAIEKTVTVKPNGKENVILQSGFFEREIAFDVNFPADAFPRHRKTEIKIYPNMFAHIAESVESLLERPHGCGEQTTSSTYPNLLILKYEKQFPGAIDAGLKAKARKYLGDGYRRLLNYQTDSGFGYWNGNSPDVALTAYVLRFLHDAEEFIEVDQTVVEKGESWLLSRQKSDGSFENSDVTTAYVARSLSLTANNKNALQKSVEFLKNGLKENNDAFVLANLILTAVEIGDAETAHIAATKLSDNGNSFWTTDQTPFNGWGKSAEIETTALVLQTFLKLNQQANFNTKIGEGFLYLLKNKDEHGVWFSTQTTVNVLDAMILYQKLQKTNFSANEKAEIFIGGAKVKEFQISGNNLRNPFVFDASQFLNQANKIEIKGFQNPAMAQIVSTYYTDWRQDENAENKYFDLTVNFDKTTAKIGEEIICRIRLQRKEARNGMILAEIGIPPGADVDRALLETAVADGNISRYDVLPDKIIAYLWANRDAKSFAFKFKPRYGIHAQNSASTVYDYYNAEAKATIAPLRFSVR